MPKVDNDQAPTRLQIVYVVASASKTWIEVVPDAAGEPLPTEEMDRSLRCTGIQKALSYRLEADRSYLLQVSESAEAQVDVLVQTLIAAKTPIK